MRQQAHLRPVVDPEHQAQHAEPRDHQADGERRRLARRRRPRWPRRPAPSTPSCSQGMPGPPPAFAEPFSRKGAAALNTPACSGEQPEDVAPVAALQHQPAEQRPQQGGDRPRRRSPRRTPAPGAARGTGARWPPWRSRRSSREPRPWISRPSEEGPDVGRQRAHHAAAGHDHAGQRRGRAQAEDLREPPGAGAGQDRAHQEARRRPAEIGVAAELGADAGHDGGGHQAVGGVQPDAQADQREARQPAVGQQVGPAFRLRRRSRRELRRPSRPGDLAQWPSSSCERAAPAVGSLKPGYQWVAVPAVTYQLEQQGADQGAGDVAELVRR